MTQAIVGIGRQTNREQARRLGLPNGYIVPDSISAEQAELAVNAVRDLLSTEMLGLALGDMVSGRSNIEKEAAARRGNEVLSILGLS